MTYLEITAGQMMPGLLGQNNKLTIFLCVPAQEQSTVKRAKLSAQPVFFL
jgi:hypothetical protein